MLHAVAPVSVLYLPQSLQVVLTTCVTLYLPASQPWHVAVSAVLEYLSAGQFKHVFTDEAPVAPEYVPAVQLLAHALAPASEENFPAAQLRQTSTEEAPATVAYLPATHDTHQSGEDAQREPRCLPAGQAVQMEEPVASE